MPQRDEDNTGSTSTRWSLRNSWTRFRRPITRERRKEVLDPLGRESVPGFDYFFLVVLSCLIATLGLLADSPAVIIGAMLVAPLMSPILGLSLASVTGRRRLLQDASLALMEGAAVAIALSVVAGWLGRQSSIGALGMLPAEVISRTRPTPLDLFVALAQPAISAALPGVAIAIALMPPLCAVGIGIAFGHGSWPVS